MSCYLTELLIPRLTKATDKRFFEKLIYGKAKRLPFFYGITAHSPFVIIQTYQSVAEILFTNGIKGTADRLAETRLATAIGFLQGTEAAVLYRLPIGALHVFIAGEDTILASHNTRHQVAILVGIGHTLVVYHALCRSGEHRPYGVETLLNASYLVYRDRCAVCAFHTADALALLIVAAEPLRQDVRRNQYVAYF